MLGEITASEKDGVLTLTIKLVPSAERKPSASGKTLIAATTGGFQMLKSGLSYNLTICEGRRLC